MIGAGLSSNCTEVPLFDVAVQAVKVITMVIAKYFIGLLKCKVRAGDTATPAPGDLSSDAAARDELKVIIGSEH